MIGNIARVLLCAALVPEFVAACVAQEVRYTHFQVPNSVLTTAIGINNAGDVVGFYSGNADSGGFTFIAGQFSDFNDPEELLPGSTVPYAINTTGEIVGDYYIGDNQRRAFLYTGGKFYDIKIPGHVVYSQADGINNSGQIVGMYNGGGGHLWHGYSYDRTSGTFTTIDVPGAYYTWCAGINDHGEVALFSEDAGATIQHAWLYDGGQLTNIDVPGYDSTVAEGINNAGAVTLIAVQGFYNFGFVYQAGEYTAVGLPGALSNELRGINDHGQLVGNFFFSEKGEGSFLATLPQ